MRSSCSNVSYDPTRELYREVNEQVRREVARRRPGKSVNVQMSHSGSGSQARAVIDGLDADVVTLALAWDIDNIQINSHRLPANWQTRLPDNSVAVHVDDRVPRPQGESEEIHDWPDLLADGVQVITPNPKTSGGARWNYLAAWGFALERALGGDLGRLVDAPQGDIDKAQAEAEAFVRDLYRHVPVQDTGARAATNTFVQRGIGDVLLAWENEALLAQAAAGAGRVRHRDARRSAFSRSRPSRSSMRSSTASGTRGVAEAYLEYPLHRPKARTSSRGTSSGRATPNVAAKLRGPVSADSGCSRSTTLFGGWREAQTRALQRRRRLRPDVLRRGVGIAAMSAVRAPRAARA